MSADPFAVLGPRGQDYELAARQRTAAALAGCAGASLPLVITEFQTHDRQRVRLVLRVRPTGYRYAGERVLALDALGSKDNPAHGWSGADYALASDTDDLARLLASHSLNVTGEPFGFVALLDAFDQANAV